MAQIKVADRKRESCRGVRQRIALSDLPPKGASNQRAFTAIEMIGVLSVIALLVAATAAGDAQ